MILNLWSLNSKILYATQFLVNCVAAKSRSVSPALATIDGINVYSSAKSEIIQ